MLVLKWICYVHVSACVTLECKSFIITEQKLYVQNGTFQKLAFHPD